MRPLAFFKPLYNLTLRVSQRATCQNHPELLSDCAFQTPIRMSRTSHGGRSRTWHIGRIMHTSLLPEAISGLSQTNSNIHPWVILFSQFQKLFMTDKRPYCISYIHLRVAQAAFENCVWSGSNGAPLPDLPFTGYIQAKNAIDQSRLRSWLDAQWDPVGGRLISHLPYRDFFLATSNDATAAAFVYFLVHGIAALGRGGRRPKGLAETPTVNRCSTSMHMQASASLH